jgi:hypothetical protein
MNVLFVHKKSVSKRKVCIIFKKNKNLKKTQKIFLVVFLGFFGWVFFIANPGSRRWRHVAASTAGTWHTAGNAAAGVPPLHRREFLVAAAVGDEPAAIAQSGPVQSQCQYQYRGRRCCFSFIVCKACVHMSVRRERE